MNHAVKIVLSILLASLLMSCGFQLRGSNSNQLGQSIPVIHLSGINLETGFGRELTAVLSANGVKLEDKAKTNIPTMRLKPVAVTRQVLSVDRDIRAREYVLISTVSYILSGVETPASESKEIKVSVRRELVVDPNRILGSDQEEKRLRKEMQSELAQLVALRLRL